jgi:hypothetical protein
MRKNQTPTENLIDKLAAAKLFRLISLIQIFIHLCAYIAVFIKLIMIEAGGYYDIGVMIFIGITIISMPLFAIARWLIQHSLNRSKRQRNWGYCFNLLTLVWSILIIGVSYLR